MWWLSGSKDEFYIANSYLYVFVCIEWVGVCVNVFNAAFAWNKVSTVHKCLRLGWIGI